jgi:rSAM/selenodomain-associated transferase 1
MNRKNKLIIFVKNEELGKTKTRLAATIGDEAALNAYRKLLNYTFTQTQNVEAEKVVWYSRYKGENDIWSEGYFQKKVQSGADLGQRMSNAFRDSFDEDGIEKVIVIGSDCAELTTEIIEAAFQQLESHECVIGPARDGGYYLLGMKTYYPEIFEDVSWSTASVFNETVQQMEALGTSYSMLKKLNDVDTIEDWKEVKDAL